MNKCSGYQKHTTNDTIDLPIFSNISYRAIFMIKNAQNP